MSDKQINKLEMSLSVTQAQLILNYIAERGSITSLEAITQLGITQLSSRISELRRKGYNIEKVPERVKNRYGKSCTILRYYLVNNEGTTNEPRANLEKSREILIPKTDMEHMGARRKEVTNR